MTRIEPLTPPTCEEMVRSRNSKAVVQLKEMGKEVSYLDRRVGIDDHRLDADPRSAL